MSFFSEAASMLGLDAAKISAGYQFINYNGEAVYIEGFKRVVSISDAEMIFELKGGRIVLKGEGLYVFLLESTTVIIKGKIVSCSSEI